MRESKLYRVSWWTNGRRNNLICTYTAMLEKVLELVQDRETLELNVSIHEA